MHTHQVGTPPCILVCKWVAERTPRHANTKDSAPMHLLDPSRPCATLGSFFCYTPLRFNPQKMVGTFRSLLCTPMGGKAQKKPPKPPLCHRSNASKRITALDGASSLTTRRIAHLASVPSFCWCGKSNWSCSNLVSRRSSVTTILSLAFCLSLYLLGKISRSSRGSFEPHPAVTSVRAFRRFQQ